jgi:hypothetical protein
MATAAGTSRGSNETHESKTDLDSKLYRKGKTGSELRYMGHTLTDNHHGLVVNAMSRRPTASPSVRRPRS